MGLRESLGGQLEDVLNGLVDKHLDSKELSEKIAKEIAKLIEKYVGDDLKHKIKADIIDLIDGEDDIK
jgi:hypothetical protein